MVSQFSVSHPYLHLRDAMHQLLEDSVVMTAGRNGTRTPVRSLPLDVYSTQDEVVVLAAVPGMDPRDLEISYTQNTLTLSGTMPSATNSEEGKRGTWYMSELWHGAFRRSLTLPFEVEDGKAEATFEHGIVRIVLPKAERSKPQKIAIRVADPSSPAIDAETSGRRES
jgi:HSP20 family protein